MRDTTLQRGPISGSVDTHHEELTATYPDAVWTAGQPESFKIALSGASRTVMPDWDVKITPLGTALWRDLPITGDSVTVPPTAAGLYQVRITAGSGTSEYLLRDVIEVHQPGSKGTITTISTQGRIYYGRGEPIDAQVFTRCASAVMPKALTLTLTSESGPVSATTLTGAKEADHCDSGDVHSLARSRPLSAVGHRTWFHVQSAILSHRSGFVRVVTVQVDVLRRLRKSCPCGRCPGRP